MKKKEKQQNFYRTLQLNFLTRDSLGFGRILLFLDEKSANPTTLNCKNIEGFALDKKAN
jgi:hypothetical protein